MSRSGDTSEDDRLVWATVIRLVLMNFLSASDNSAVLVEDVNLSFVKMDKRCNFLAQCRLFSVT